MPNRLLARTALWVIVASQVFTGCGIARGLMQQPAASSAPDGCAWVVREEALLYHKTLYLCCAVDNLSKPVCREADWD